jgi:hypothetical protein
MTRAKTESRATPGRHLVKQKQSAERSSDLPAAIRLGEHGRYQIKSGRLSGEYVARAFPKPPTNARGLIAEARGATEEAAIAALYDVIDAREVRRTDERRADATTGVTIPSTEEYAEALAHVTLSQPQRAILTALAFADEGGVAEWSLASAAGYKSNASANRALASAGLLIASYLSLETPADDASNDYDGAMILAYRGKKKKEEDPGNWILHAEMRQAVRAGR